MATSSPVRDVDGIPPQDKWGPPPDVVPDHLAHVGGPGDLDRDLVHGPPPHNGDALGPPLDHGDAYHTREPSPGDSHKSGPIYREKQIKPNKVYIGGLPEHTRQEDLRNCFGKIGEILNIELKLGYGFVEFATREAAEESVAKYHEGTFMGNKIRVELSHGGGRTAKYTGDPGACFKCGQHGHWARECPNHVIQIGPGPHRRSNPPPYYNQDTHVDGASSRDYPPPPQRDYPGYREEYGRYPPRDARYSYDYPPPGREYRRPPSPPREYRDYAYPRRDYDDYRMRPPPPPPSSRGYYDGAAPAYPPRGYDVPRDAVDRRAAPPAERYPPYPPPGARPRTPPGPPPRARDDYERAPREYGAPPPAADYRGRPVSPPTSARYGDYPPRSAGGSEQSIGRYRHRSQSPAARNGSGTYRSGSYVNDQGPESAPYPSAGAGNSYSSSAGAYSGNGYSGGPTGSVPPRGGGGVRDREYTPRSGGADVNVGYSRRA